MNNVVVLTTGIDCLKTMLWNLSPEVLKNNTFHIVNDDRNFPIMLEIKLLVKDVEGLKYKLYSGKEVFATCSKRVKIPGWLTLWKRGVKVLLPIYFEKFVEYLYLDDDVVLFKDPTPLFDYEFCASHKRVLGSFSSRRLFNSYKEHFPKVKESMEEWNKNMMNSGIMIWTNGVRLDYYKECFERCLNSKFLHNIFWKGTSLGDEPFLTMFMKSVDAVFTDGSVLCTNQRAGFTFKRVWEPLPYAYHYDVSDQFLPDFWDFFNWADYEDNKLTSWFENKEEFIIRPAKSKMVIRKDLARVEWQVIKEAQKNLKF